MKIYPSILVLVVVLLVYQHLGCGKRLTKRKICLGTSGRMSVPTNRKHHYKNLKDRYTNCTYVDGNLELTWIEDENLDLSFLNEIREITGYLLISHVDVKRIVFKKLMIIRGRNLFKLNVRNEMFALIVTLSKMESLELPSLRDILAGSTGFYNNYNLCYIRTIKWDELLYSPTQKPIIVYNFTEAERDCPECHSSCEDGCWGPGAENCQVFSKINCSPQCFQGRCFGPNPRECCHLFCVGGCTGPTQADCLACKNFYDGGVCKQECPPMIRYNTVKYVLESNPDGRYAYGATCVKNCPDHLLRDSGACVRTCPPNKKAENKTCILCDGPCPKNCIGVDIINADNIANFEGCTVIQGSITILDTSFEGYQDVYSNFTFGPRHEPMHPSKLNAFKNLREVTGYISIQASHPDFKNLSYFSSLEKISGRTLTEYFAALYIVKTSLQSLNMRSLKSINSGSVAILENQDLCLTDTINWQKIMKSNSHSILMEGNGKNCKSRNMICHPECSSDGCWGIDPNECLSCQNFILDNTCIDRCDPLNGMYDAGNHICKKCHKECLGQCSGPGNSNCTNCKNVRDGPYCVSKCPITKYNNNSVCLPCHENCVDGCVGPENNIGAKGCLSCEKAIVDSLDPNIVIQCLKSDEPCPENHYLEYILGYPLEGALKSLTGKSVCRKCHPQCSNCTAYGTHYSICKCLHYISGETCDDHCPRDNFADEDRHVCIKCSDECRGGCYGSTSHDCIACRNFRVYIDSENKTSFNCTPSCPFDKPHKIFMENDPYCSDEANVLFHGSENDDNVPAIIGGILSIFIVLGILLAVVSYYCLERARTKENTVKMTMRMSGFDDNEPLKPTDVKPNLAKLRIIKEHELRKGGILGYGAFGTVFKGVWLPTDENTTSGTIKIPVAIKVLQESSTSKDFLEEAFIMASVDHPNLLKLLAVCIANECMLVTQLMPLGCLLDYVRNNKEKIGSKALLNWAAQIARGMAYLEQHRMVHRDLALRNVLLQTPGCVKVTDFGLARLLDLNEEEYKALGNNKVAIKWLALECIENRSFSHKSDVWAFGITIWEMFTYGKRPYENVLARDVPNLLRKGERLPQPEIATIDVYMIMIKTWMLDAESRPCFKELADEFSKMARDPGRYLVILGDKYMRLPSYTPQDEKELIRTLSMPIEGPEVIMDAEEYLQQNRDPITTESQPPPTPIKKFMDDRGFEMDPVTNSLDNSEEIKGNQNEVKNACFENCKGPNHVCKDTSLSTRYCSDPVSSLERGEVPNIGITQQHPKEVKVNLPVDDEDYLVPSSQSCNSPGYMDLVEDAKISSSVPSYSRNFYPTRNVQPHAPAVDNLEYHLMNKSTPTSLDPPVEIQRKPISSDEDTDEHEYYNDYDGLRRELQPLNNHRSETTV